jgi:hypothetical protein
LEINMTARGNPRKTQRDDIVGKYQKMKESKEEDNT